MYAQLSCQLNLLGSSTLRVGWWESLKGVMCVLCAGMAARDVDDNKGM